MTVYLVLSKEQYECDQIDSIWDSEALAQVRCKLLEHEKALENQKFKWRDEFVVVPFRLNKVPDNK